MVKIKVKYLVEHEKSIELTTREWCELYADKSSLVKLLAKENKVEKNNIIVRDGYCDIFEGQLNYKNLDE
jgi:hypothetical protein